jgi:hypothetical protein
VIKIKNKIDQSFLNFKEKIEKLFNLFLTMFNIA